MKEKNQQNYRLKHNPLFKAEYDGEGHFAACEKSARDLRKVFRRGCPVFSVVKGHTNYYLIEMTRTITALRIRIQVVVHTCSFMRPGNVSLEMSNNEYLKTKARKLNRSQKGSQS